MNILVTVIIFSALIIIHEFGHFIAARQAGVKVERFSIGFGPPLFKIKGKETDFLVCLLPLGGYVKLAGDIRSGCKGLNHEFLSRAPGIKMRIVFAGPLFNYLFALIIFWIIAMVGFPYPDTVIGKVLEDYPAYNAGLKEGDRILEVNGKKVDNWTEMTKVVYSVKDKVSLKIERDKEVMSFDVPLRSREVIDSFGKKKNETIMGIIVSSKIKIVKYSFPKALIKGTEALFNLTFFVVKGFIFLILGAIPFRESMTGPLGIYYVTSEVVKIGGVAVLHLMAVLNVSLAIVNIFPLPILDGGHIFLFFIEKIRKKNLSKKTEDILTYSGIILICTLIAFVFYNDIIRFGPKIWGNKNSAGSQEIVDDKQ